MRNPAIPVKATPQARAAQDDGFAVAGWMDIMGGLIARHSALWIALGNVETRLASAAMEDVTVDRPIYIAGLARSGSTILLETLARHPDVATHRYRDYPPVFTPYLWNRWLDRVPKRVERPAERTHKDGIAVTSESPEAFEEVLWMAFFPALHDPAHSAVLDRTVHNTPFEAFYRDHLRKLIAVRGRRRYLAKGNYNITRLDYLHRLFPDARFIIPVRDPVWHIASLMKQQALFSDGQRRNPKAVRHLKRVGHFEFGVDRRAINPGDSTAVAEIADLWQHGREVVGWAKYWALIHGHIADQLEARPEVRKACYVIRYEDLCAAPRETIRSVLDHCGLTSDAAFVESAAAGIRFPAYYKPAFTDRELALIQRETAAVARQFRYDSGHRQSTTV